MKSKKFSRILALLLAITLMPLGVLPFSAQAAEAEDVIVYVNGQTGSDAADQGIGALNALGGNDREAASVDLDEGAGVEAVVSGPDRELAAGNIKEALLRVLVVVGVDRVLAGREDQAAAGDADGIPAFERMAGGFHVIAAGADLEVVL